MDMNNFLDKLPIILLALGQLSLTVLVIRLERKVEDMKYTKIPWEAHYGDEE